jgi:O-antigen/teichoic acid export membrane protein
MTQNLRGDGIRGEKERRARGEMVGKTFTVSIICGVWMSLAIGLGAPFLIDVIGGSQARGAVSVLRIQGLVLTLSFVSVSNAFNLVALRRYRSLAIASGCALAFNILLAVALVSILGAKGGALADVIAELMLAIALTVVLMHAVPRYQIRVSLVRSVLLAAALAVIVLLAPVGSLVRVIGATFIYFGVLRLMGAIPDEVLNVARRLPPLRTPS